MRLASVTAGRRIDRLRIDDAFGTTRRAEAGAGLDSGGALWGASHGRPAPGALAGTGAPVPFDIGGTHPMGGCSGCQYKGASTAVESTFVGVRFGEETNLTLCATGETVYAKGQRVVVDREGGVALGHVEQSPMAVFKPCQKAGAKRIVRHASDDDLRAWDRQQQNQATGKRFCQERARELGLEMKISRVDFPLYQGQATFYFTAEGRVDFRQLVRDLSRRFSTRVRMIQVGARDEARLLGGIGVCGRTLCCSTWLKDFRPISIQMAKRQNLSLNPSKISGQCGRLLCCLAYEDSEYKNRKSPPASTLPVVDAEPENGASWPIES